MAIGDIPADWRVRRLAVRVSFNDEEGRFPHGVQFVDVESAETREALRPELAALLAFYGYDDLDVPMVRGRDRRVTRWISQWAYEATGDDGRPLYAGIRYVSRLNSDWTCWAVFDDVSIDELTRRPILVTDPDYRAVATLYGLTPY
jgi:hypothetical protein